MIANELVLRESLARIAAVAAEAMNGGTHAHRHEDGHAAEEPQRGPVPACTPKALPERLLVKAARAATRINPVNAPSVTPFAAGLGLAPLPPARLAVLTSKYWGPALRQLTVSFMGSTAADLRRRIVAHMNAWTRTACVSFVETQGTGQIRISRDQGGYWSYLGTDVLLIPKNRPTMNLEGFTMSTPDAEYARVVRHETGHTLGMPHEHMRKELIARIDREKAYAYFLQTQGWDRDTVDQQVLTALDDRSIMATPPDQTSIMCYQLPGRITHDGEPILGGLDINATDYAFAGRIYPKPGQEPEVSGNGHGCASSGSEEWDESEDVDVGV